MIGYNSLKNRIFATILNPCRMKPSPIIGVTPLWDAERKSVWMLPDYLDGIKAAGGIPVILPIEMSETDADRMTATCDGFLFTGGQDVAPELYGTKDATGTVVPSPERDRLETLLHIKIGDVDFAEREIRLTKLKNRRQYTIPLSAQLSKVLREYLLYRKGKPDDYLFCSSFGNQLNRGTLQKQITVYNHSRGVERTSIHAFRHTFAKNWILNGGDILSLQTILGHSSMEMVKEYVALFGKDLQNGFDSHNPLDVIAQKTQRKDYIQMKK